MRVLITGGTGLIGSHLRRELAAGGHEVVVLTRDPSAAGALPPGVRAVGWDAKTATGWGHLVAGAAIVHLAGENIGAGRWTAARKRRIYDSRVRSGEAVLAAVEQAEEKPRVLLQASGVGCYGDGGARELDEGSPLGSGFLAEVCRDWEAVTADVEALGVRRAVLRTAMVLAREGGALPRLALPFRLFAGGTVGGADAWRPWIHVADHVAAIRFLLAHETASGPFNLTAPRPVTARELARTLGRVLRRPSLLPAPSFAVRLALGEMADALLVSQRAVPRRLAELGFSFRFPDLEAALRDLLR